MSFVLTDEQPRLRLGPPVTVAVARLGEKRWGFHQFPKLSWLPGDHRRILLTYNQSDDDDLAYGVAGPALVSADRGATWAPFRPADDAEARLSVSHSPICDVGGGEAICVPMPPGRPPEEIPRDLIDRSAVGRFRTYGWRTWLPLECLPAQVQAHYAALDAVRWSPTVGRWQATKIAWDTRGALLRLAEGNSWSPTSFEQRTVVLDGQVLWADYKTGYRRDDGTAPPNMEVICMASLDGGRSFVRRSVIAPARGPEDMQGEPELTITSRGEVACVVRQAHHDQRPMVIAFSSDAGRSWEPTCELHPFGVMPRILRLAAGPIVVAFGRPGVHLMLSMDGSARRWTRPVTLIDGDPQDLARHTCGYTDLIPLGDEEFLLAYSDFEHPHPAGGTCKAILVRPVRVLA